MNFKNWYNEQIKETFPSLVDFDITNVPTKEMVKRDLSDHKYKVLCYLCGKPIVASTAPIPKDLLQFIKGTPCSECVPNYM